jgi:hypothetical protein
VSRPVQVALQRAQPAVVHISVTSNNNAGGEQSGTGFLILSDPTGAYVVTAAHVVGNVNSMTVQKRVTIVLQNGHSLQPVDLAEGTPNQGDVAVIKVRPQKGLAEAVAKFVPTSQVQVGDVAWAIGYLGSSTSTDSLGGSTIPLGLGDNNRDAAITQPGLVSNIGVKLGGISYLTTNATLVEGMSGGPLVFVGTGGRSGLSGCVIGIDAAYAGAVRRGGQFPNLNLVLPSDTVLPLIHQLLARFHPLPVGSVGSC